MIQFPFADRGTPCVPSDVTRFDPVPSPESVKLVWAVAPDTPPTAIAVHDDVPSAAMT